MAADGTQVDTYIDDLLAETSIRYGGFGGIAYHYISDTYVALFSRFIPCGVWEAVHLIEGLLANTSDIQPSTVHADTQDQNFPVFNGISIEADAVLGLTPASSASAATPPTRSPTRPSRSTPATTGQDLRDRPGPRACPH